MSDIVISFATKNYYDQVFFLFRVPNSLGKATGNRLVKLFAVYCTMSACQSICVKYSDLHWLIWGVMQEGAINLDFYLIRFKEGGVW